ncbi:serine hydrolase [Mucilaginibacter segetis]|uniref:Serine hydrolase n=1 Tax=Mucilaginibacter segetis TaxID=2793071 RepID=A0A934UP74_9SPHI|nr:serine hydrolase [Mucilaginibacter segetis]MBK0380631.1 serine hydrolase [Mucilaginibacter segetis]
MKRLTLLLLLAVPVVTMAQSIAEKADGLLTTYAQQNRFSGNVLIAIKGEIVFEKAYGYADKENNRLNNLQTEFRAGSLTKMFTSTLIMQLVEARKIALTDKVSKYVPGFPYGDKITIKNLLSHTSGILGTTSPDADNAADLVKTFKSEPLAFNPGERFEYNNFNYILLAYIAQKITGVSYPQLVKQRVFNKAGMIHTGIDYPGRKSTDAALGYTLNRETGQTERIETANVSAASGAGALYTTVNDLLKWAKAIDEHKVLSVKSYETAITPVQPGYGLGWIVNNDSDRLRIGHTGSIEGFMADFVHYPKEDITIIFLCNLLPPVDMHIERALIAIVFNEPYSLETDKKEIKLSTDELAQYTGTFETDGQKMVVSVKDGKLYVLAPGGDTAELAAQAKDKFFVVGPQVSVEFLRKDGKIDAISVDMHGGITFKKVL